MDAAHANRRKLGELLVEEGFLTADQLAEALEEARATGQRLGTVLVGRGYLSGPALANVLADQQGGIVRTEYGIATGYRKTWSAPPTEPERESAYVLVVAKEGRYVMLAGAGALPEEGTQIALPMLPNERFVVKRHEWRQCVVVEPAQTAPQALSA